MKKLRILPSANTDKLEQLIQSAENAACGWLQSNPRQQALIAPALKQLSNLTNKKENIDFKKSIAKMR